MAKEFNRDQYYKEQKEKAIKAGLIDPDGFARNKTNEAAEDYAAGRGEFDPNAGWEDRLMDEKPGFESIRDAQGNVTGAYKHDTSGYLGELEGKLGGINLNTQGLDKFRSEALREGPSKWAGLAETKQGAEEAAARDNAAKQAASGAAQARANAAMRGGVGGGMASRLAQMSTRDLMAARQDVARQGILQRANISQMDEEGRVRQLAQLPGMELGKSQFDLNKLGEWQKGQSAKMQSDQFNITNALADLRAKQQADQEAWKQKGTIKTQQATNAAASKGK